MQLAQVLSKAFPDERIACVSSQSEHRIRDVEAFRQGELSLLISTTILERGVTFPKVDVFIMNAHHKVYTASSLVQISGRVGRDLQRPTGKLIFFHNGLTKDMIDAIKSIKLMNRIGGF
jgi:competence protein ComFA